MTARAFASSPVVTFNTDYLPVALILLGAAWAVIKWVGRSLAEIAGDSIELEDRRLIEHVNRNRRTAQVAHETSRAPSVRSDAVALDAGDRAFDEERRLLDMTRRELAESAPVTEKTAAMSQQERQRIYDQLVRDLDAQGATEAERAFALAVAMNRLGLRGGTAAADLTTKRR